MVSLKRLLLLLSVYFLGVVGVMVLGYFFLPSRYQPLPFLSPWYQTNFLLWSFANFDGEHYLKIALYGYQTVANQSQFAFFPLFPLLIAAFSRLIPDVYLVAHLIVATAFIIWARYLGHLSALKGWRYGPWLALCLLFPGTIFYTSIYTESLFLCLTVFVFYYSEKGSWGRATLFAALATATRINGVMVVLFLVAQLLARSAWRRALVSGLAGLAGLGGYMLYLYRETGNPLAFFAAQAGWGKNSLTPPWITLARYAEALTSGWQYDLTHYVVLVEVLLTLYLLGLFVISVLKRYLTWPYLLYSAGNLALPILTGSLGSMPRFGLLLFPLFVAATHLRPRQLFVLYLISGLLAASGIILFTRGYWWA